jgi:NADPH:quinone reductase-like Zn-dependent oxidoreductase
METMQAVRTDTMKAVRIHAYGGPEVLVYEDAPKPRPGRNEALVRVHAAGVNPVDWKIREGYARDRMHHKLPLILGWDVAGVIDATGSGVKRFKVGDAIFSRPDSSRDGAYAEYIIIKESELAPKPKSLDFIQAAAIPLACTTAWQAIFDTARLSAGQKILIHAAAGGVGSYAVQLAKWRGAHVIGTASAASHDLLRRLGADETIDYQNQRFEDVVHDADVVLDTIGGDTQKRSFHALRRGGILVSIVAPPSEQEATEHGVREAYIFMHPDAAELTQIAALVDAGKLKPIVDTVLPLSEAHKAHALSRSGHTHGKIVLKVEQE